METLGLFEPGVLTILRSEIRGRVATKRAALRTASLRFL